MNPVGAEVTATINDRQAIQELVYRYAWCSDARDFAAMEQLFASDATLAIERLSTGTRSEVTGPKEIAAWVDERHREEFALGHRRRHVTTNFLLDHCDGMHASSRAYICIVVSIDGAPPQLTAMGWYEDRFRKVDGQWLFGSRLVRLEGK